ncbi:MAG: SRPBCC domain-containing protein [Deltaproteobacteria bacterium]|nr:SRPBCC domain-containing protein [Deltaproteobacteria bacterium]
MSAGLSTGPAPADRVLVITRLFDGPRSLVFKAWTDSGHLAHWFGPRGFEMTFCKMDLRPGGSYRFGMHSAEGTEHWLQGVYQEIVEPEKLVCTYAWADANGNATRPETLLELTFAEQDGKTSMTLRQSVFESVTACDLHRGGWTSSLDRLAEYVTRA